jgi:hypothetical protein
LSLRRIRLSGAAIAACLTAGCRGSGSPVAPGTPTSFECSQVIGFSQTAEWYTGGFESAVDGGRWQLLWRSGANIDFWADPDYEGWSQPIVSPCASGSASPDRVVLTISGNLQSDPGWWANQIRAVVATLRDKYPRARQILLQPVVGGPGHAECMFQSQLVRASSNHPVIDQAIALVAADDVAAGASPEVRSCGDYRDSVGHLATEAHQSIGQSIGRFYAALDLQAE